MNYIQRLILSVKRNFKNMLPLIFVVFILGNVVCSAIAIRQSTLQTKQEFISNYGTKIKLSYNTGIENIINDFNKSEYIKIDEIFKSCNLLPIYTYSNISYVSNLFSIENLKYTENENIYYKDYAMPVYLWGSSNEILIDEKEHEIELIDGKHFSKDDILNSNKVIIVSENYKLKDNDKYRDVQIGDNIEITRTISSNNENKYIINEKFEVIGIYKESMYSNNSGYSIDNILTKLYIPLSSLEMLIDKYNSTCKEAGAYANNKLFAADAYFQLINNDYYKNFIDCYYNTLENRNIPEGFELKTSNEIYEKIGTPIESLSKIADFILIISSIVSIIVLCLIIVIIIRNRKYEIGILNALGEKKKKIVLQFVLEIFLISIMSLSLSTISGCELGKIYSKFLIKKEEIIEDEYTQEDVIGLYQVEYTKEYALSVLGIGSTIITLSTVLPITYIIKINPKKILL